MVDAGEEAALRLQVRRIAEASGVELAADFDDDTSLIQSGLLDSAALFELVLWMEDWLGPELDVASFDLPQEWDTIRQLLAFAERYRSKRV